MFSDYGNSSRENQKFDVKYVMRSLDVSRCAGEIGQSTVVSTTTRVCGIGKGNVFEVCASGDAGDLRFARIQNKKKV